MERREKSSTDLVKDKLFSSPYYADVVKIKDVEDAGPEKYIPKNWWGTDYILNDYVPRKSVKGNNGNFDFGNPNIYKIIFPIGVIGTSSSLLQK